MKKIKYFIFILLLIPCMFLFSACGSKVVVGIKKVDTIGNSDVYSIVYSDGTEDAFTVNHGKDGKDAQSITIEDVYNAAVDAGFNGDMLDFIKVYLEVDIETGSQNNVSTAILSAVSVYSEFPSSSFSLIGGTIKDVSIGAGSGVIYKLDKANGDAYVITNYHVVYSANCSTNDKIASKINCFLYGALNGVGYKTGSNGSKIYENGYPVVEYSDDVIPCEYVGGSMQYDIAVLKISGSEILKNSEARAISVANSDKIGAGNKAIAIGNPSGAGISVSEGVVSVDSEYIDMTGADETTQVQFRVMRVDTAINSGNSGGGLFNEKGELIGIVNAKIIDANIENIGYAIPSNIATRVADNILEYASSHNKKAFKPTIGITVEIKASRAIFDEEILTTRIVEDVYINSVENSSLAKDKLQPNDKLVSIKIQNKVIEIERMYQIVDSTWLMRVGDVVEFTVLRNGAETTVTIIATNSAFKVVE